MSPPVTRLAWLWLVGGLSMVVAPHLLHLPPALGLLCVAMIAWRLACDIKGWPLPRAPLRIALTAAAIGAVILAYGTIVGREPGVALLAIMLSLKLMEMRSERDAVIVLLLAYFLVATGFLLNQSILAGIYLFGAVAVLTAALVVLHHPAGSAAFSGHYLRQAGALLIQALPLMLALFLLFPRLSGPLWGSGEAGQGARTGLSGEMNIGDITDLASSGEVAFRVEFKGRPPAAEELYWRGPVLWHTDGRRWQGLTAAEMSEVGEAPRIVPLGPPVEYVVTLQPHGRHWLLALDLPAALPAEAALTPDLQLLATLPLTQVRRYALRSYPRYRVPDLSPSLRRAALALPAGVNPRTAALARAWSAGAADQEVVGKALRLFREQPFFYTRRPPGLGLHAVDQFLFESRRGFCEHYAAAFVTLMRGAGIPARVVTGYQGGQANPLGGYLLVRQADAHAWAEVYLEGSGWVRIDPTSVIPPQRVVAEADLERFRNTAPAFATEGLLGSGLARLRQGWDAVNHGWNRWVLGYGEERQQELLQRLGFDRRTLGEMATLLTIAVALTLGGVALLLQGGGREGDPALRAYRRFLRKTARCGVARGVGEGESEFARRVAALRPERGAAAREITALFQRLRYGPPTASDGTLEALRRAVARYPSCITCRYRSWRRCDRADRRSSPRR